MMESKKITGIPACCNCIACGKPLSRDGSEPYIEMHMVRSASEWANVYAHEECFHKAAEDIYDAYMAGEMHMGEEK